MLPSYYSIDLVILFHHISHPTVTAVTTVTTRPSQSTCRLSLTYLSFPKPPAPFVPTCNLLLIPTYDLSPPPISTDLSICLFQPTIRLRPIPRPPCLSTTVSTYHPPCLSATAPTLCPHPPSTHSIDSTDSTNRSCLFVTLLYPPIRFYNSPTFSYNPSTFPYDPPAFLQLSCLPTIFLSSCNPPAFL